jgi:hypothetical protein|tara:strand:+ start:137 stop:481 length:345 start_codon:yes stop_codon:yes gene_type:complete
MNNQTHPDFDNNEFMAELLTALQSEISVEFADISYKNDTCPSLGYELKHSQLLQCHVEYKNPDLREYSLEESKEVVIFNLYNSEGDIAYSASLKEFNVNTAIKTAQTLLQLNLI